MSSSTAFAALPVGSPMMASEAEDARSLSLNDPTPRLGLVTSSSVVLSEQAAAGEGEDETSPLRWAGEEKSELPA